MQHNVRQYLRDKWKGMTAVVAFSGFMAGMVVASSLPWTPLSVADSRDPAAQALTTPGYPASFADLVERLSPMVVNIQVTKVAPVGNFPGALSPEGPSGDFFGRFFREGIPSQAPRRMQGSGSGVIISREGHILTNNHVIDGAQDVTVTLADRQTYTAQVVGRDPKTDLAVVRIDARTALPVAPLGNSADLRVGDWVVAIGNPFGLSHTVTAGIVSAKGRVIGTGPYDDFIQIDAPINPGNSGGPLFNLQGEMVGINTAIIAAGQGIGFAIPVDLAKPLIPQLVTTGEVARGYLGVSIQSITPELAKALKLDERQGALVSEVVQGGPAARAGVRQGDVIVGLNGAPVQDSRDLPAMVAQIPAGEDVTVTLRRQGKTQQVPVTVGKLPSEPVALEESSQAAPSQWGLQLQEMTPQMGRQHDLTGESGVIVVGVQPGSAAERAGLQRGDLLREVNGQAVQSVQAVRDALAKADGQESLLLLVRRGQGSLYVAMAK